VHRSTFTTLTRIRPLAFLLALCAALAAAPLAAQETAYVSDEVFIVLHAGPGTNYRWLGKLTPGTRLSRGGTSEDGAWAEVTTTRGTSGWVRASSSAPLRRRRCACRRSRASSRRRSATRRNCAPA
jgi:SH3 domain protein